MTLQSNIATGYSNHSIMELTHADSPYDMAFKSPMKDIRVYLNEIAFRVSVPTATDTNATQSVPYVEERTETQWLVKWIFLWPGLGTFVVAIVATLLPYWGFWELPLDHSTSPLVLIKSVVHSGDGPQSIIPVLKKAKDDTAAGLREFAREWDRRGQHLVYRQAPDGRWSFVIKADAGKVDEEDIV